MDNKDYRPADLELEQCYIRLGVPIPLLVLWYGFWLARTDSIEAFYGLFIMGAFSVYALFNCLHVKHFPGENRFRRVVSIVVDQSSCFVGMLMTGGLGGVVLFLPLWISLGNGIRFGVNWMAGSVTLALAGIAGLGLLSPYWSQHATWLVGLGLLNVAIPLYLTRLIGGFHANRRQLASYADEMKSLAMKDALTGLPNRTAFFEALERAGAHAQRSGTALAVLYFDLNGFKQVNDRFGHAVGDALLRDVAGQVQAELRTEDVLARLGGDEFVALLELDKAFRPPEQIAARILEVLAALRSVEGDPLELTASVGIVVVAGRDAAALGAERIVELADLNMYAAKREGRGKIVSTRYAPAARRLASV